jgi:hypothetical protein
MAPLITLQRSSGAILIAVRQSHNTRWVVSKATQPLSYYDWPIQSLMRAPGMAENTSLAFEVRHLPANNCRKTPAYANATRILG